jgi:hypothetical protein
MDFVHLLSKRQKKGERILIAKPTRPVNLDNPDAII